MSSKKNNRILIKLSGESLMGKKNYGIDVKIVQRLAKDLSFIKKLKLQLCIVIGGGNIFRGIAASAKGMDRANADYMGMLATVMNSLALQNSLENLNIETRVMSAFPIQSVCETYIRRRAIRHMEKNRIVICAAGTGNPYFSTDTAAALRAAELECKSIYKATKVDGIYNKDPKKYKNAKKYKNISYGDYLSKNLAVIDSAAVSIARENLIPIKVFSILKNNCFKNAYINKSDYSEITNV
jgi:uridylate kinase|tara:strand:+ start:45 stop:764 length:720 start_codon:yes stop_codon:yes gene_type:complete